MTCDGVIISYKNKMKDRQLI